ncbi:hypothetical protein Vretimale_16410 [Volvox reticuliferus]|uniref:Glycosyl transferase CAP10 domain-containing protein n=1 Tax=Volvox reticuliferus TaxID=1737510 RepID=A0A8J4LXD2_9CHLO|nr:hypothetical protein Vretimale_16410 [Volvox reticuliferus]
MTEIPGLKRETTDKMMYEIYRDNIDNDFAPWKGRSYNLRDLYVMLSQLHSKRDPGPYRSVILVKGGQVYDLPLVENYGRNRVALRRIKSLAGGLQNGSAEGVTIPDTVFLISMRDHPYCHIRGHECKVPTFAIIKRWNFTRNTSDYLDVLLPQYTHVYDQLVFYPWEKKHDKALMRASLRSRMTLNSTRQWLAELPWRHTEAAALLDTGLTKNEQKKTCKMQIVDSVSIPEHARWKYLFATDGITASSRLGKLLGINSVVVKEDSLWIEYYYRSLVPNTHYVPFNKDNVLEVLHKLRNNPDHCRRIAANAQRFSYTFLSQTSKNLYVRQAVRIYNSLVPDIKEFMQTLQIGSPVGGSGGDKTAIPALTLEGLLEQLAAFVKDRLPDMK